MSSPTLVSFRARVIILDMHKLIFCLTSTRHAAWHGKQEHILQLCGAYPGNEFLPAHPRLMIAQKYMVL